MHTLLVLTLTTLLFPALSSSASSEAPSFDCAKARRDDEKAICADPSLGALDRSIDAAYRTARDRLRSSPAALKHLKEEQALTLAGRLDAFAHPSGNGLKYYLTGWRDALARITEPHAGFEGGWASMVTFIDVKGRPDGRFSVKVQGSDMIRGSWACEYNGLGENQGDRLVVAWNRDEDGEDGADGWLLELTRTGALLTLKEVPGSDAAASPPYCGVYGGLEGAYMPAHAGAFTTARERVGYDR